MNAPFANLRAKYREGLPQLSDRLFLTDGGMETTLIFQDGIDLPYFASFNLLATDEGTDQVRRYYARYIEMARGSGLGFVLESPTWRANRDWAAKLGYTRETLAAINRKAIEVMVEMRWQFETSRTPIVISGNIGPRGDGYVPGAMMTAREAQDYHAEQVGVFRDSPADLVSAFTLNYVNEAIGVVRAAQAAHMPVVISFTVETDGRLPTGQTLGDAIAQVDAETGNGPVYYMVNCAHPTHFAGTFDDGAAWTNRVRGLRANASRRSHAELDTMTDLDIGDPAELGRQYADLRRRFRHINVVGGCCGTDHRHVEQIRLACEPVA